MIIYTTSTTKDDLLGILDLQKINLPAVLSGEDILIEGFVTVKHTYDDLKKLNDIEKHIIAREDDKVIAYVLAMTEHSKFEIPILIPMFETFSKTSYNNRFISDYNYIVVGQVCVDKNYRGKRILDNCYAAYKKQFTGKYDFAITEIDSTNKRSLNAHKRIGFKEIVRYNSADETEWCIFLWDWRKNG